MADEFSKTLDCSMLLEPTSSTMATRIEVISMLLNGPKLSIRLSHCFVGIESCEQTMFRMH